MGLAASQARFLQLTARKSDLEFQGQLINQQRMTVAYKSETLISGLNFLDPTTAAYQSKLTEIDSIHQIDQRLEIELENIDTQQQAVQTEIEAVKKVIDKNIDLTFKTFA